MTPDSFCGRILVRIASLLIWAVILILIFVVWHAIEKRRVSAEQVSEARRVRDAATGAYYTITGNNDHELNAFVKAERRYRRLQRRYVRQRRND